MLRPALTATLMLALSATADASSVYTWVDPAGITHYAEAPPTPGVPVSVPPRLLGGSADRAGHDCTTRLCDEVLAADPHCRSHNCARAREIDDGCFTLSCQDTRRQIRSWIAQRLERSREPGSARDAAPL